METDADAKTEGQDGGAGWSAAQAMRSPNEMSLGHDAKARVANKGSVIAVLARTIARVVSGGGCFGEAGEAGKGASRTRGADADKSSSAKATSRIAAANSGSELRVRTRGGLSFAVDKRVRRARTVAVLKKGCFKKSEKAKKKSAFAPTSRVYKARGAMQRRQLSTSVRRLLDARTDRFPAKDVCLFEGQPRWATADLRKNVRAFAGGLVSSAGFKPGNSLLVVGPNSLERAAFILAAAHAQAIVGVVDGKPTKEGLHAALEHSGARAVVVPLNYVDVLRAAVPELAIEIAGEGANEGRPLVVQSLPNLRRAWHTGLYKEPMVTRVRDMLLYRPLEDPLDKISDAPDAPFLASYDANGALLPDSLLTQTLLLAKAKGLAAQLALTTEDRLLLNSAAGGATATATALLACLEAGAQLIVPKDPKDTAAVERLCASERVTKVYGELAAPKLAAAAAAKPALSSPSSHGERSAAAHA